MEFVKCNWIVGRKKMDKRVVGGEKTWKNLANNTCPLTNGGNHIPAETKFYRINIWFVVVTHGCVMNGYVKSRAFLVDKNICASKVRCRYPLETVTDCNSQWWWV